MNMRHLFFWLSLSLVCSLTSTAQQSASFPFELVESTPIETTLDNPDIRDAHGVWLEMIGGAKRSLDIEQFYISNEPGEPLEDIIRATIEAAQRGVRVRLIADARMYRTYPETIDSLRKQPNITVRIIDFGKLIGSGIQHAKFFIIDGEEMFLGSQNFDWRALKHIHELGLRIRHRELVGMYSDVFELDWKLAEKNDPKAIAHLLKTKRYRVPLRFADSLGDTTKFFPTFSPRGLIPDSTLWDELQIESLLTNAKKEILLQFLVYSPINRDKSYYSMFESALRSAAARGVKIKMIVSDWAKDSPEVDHLKSLSVIPNIEVRFMVFPEWSGGYISFARVDHCKFIVVDGDRFWLGTSNGEKSYFYTLRNLGLIVLNNGLADRVREIFFKSWDSRYAEEVRPDIHYQPREHGERR